MSFNEIIPYAIVQGIGEFFPISSSAHLLLLTRLFKWTNPGEFMDVALHFGSFIAILVYFWKDVMKLLHGFFLTLTGQGGKKSQFFWILLWSTLPVVVIGFFVDSYGRFRLQGLMILAWTSLLFGLLLLLADVYGKASKHIKQISILQAFFGWGMAQCLALIPGASRSGVTITFGRAAGYTRQDAVRFSFLMALPTLLAATTLKGFHLFQTRCWGILPSFFYGSLISCTIGIGFLAFFMWWIKRFSLKFFAIYRSLLGFFLLYGVYILGWK